MTVDTIYITIPGEVLGLIPLWILLLVVGFFAVRFVLRLGKDAKEEGENGTWVYTLGAIVLAVLFIGLCAICPAIVDQARAAYWGR